MEFRMENKKILFVVPCNTYFPSGIVRVSHFLPLFEEDNIQYQIINYYSSFSQYLLRWLNRSIFHKNKWTDLVVRILFHLIGIPQHFFCMIQTLLYSVGYDVLFLQATLFPAWLIKILIKLYKNVVFDFDDAWYLQKEKLTIDSIKYANHVIGGSHALCEFAKQYNTNVTLIPSSIPMGKYDAIINESNNDLVRIGWLGGNTSIDQLSLLAEPLKYLVENNYQFEFVIAGSDNLHTVLHDIPGLIITEIPSYKDTEIPKIVKSFDIGVMPLHDTPSQQGRCGYKLLIYMAAGVPSISSPVGEANYIMNHEISGLFADSTEEWIINLTKLIEDPGLRKKYIRNGIKTINERYSIQYNYPLLKSILFTYIIGEN